MKKFLTVSFVLLILMSTMLSAFAANGSFISSPSKQLAPELIEAKNASDECTAEIVITSYADRATLGDKADMMTQAYAIIASAENLGTVDADIAELAKELNIDSADFAVSDLFDISYVDCDGHELHGEFTITIKPASTENFAALLHYTGTEWEVIEGTVENGEITFEAELFSPFAIMVHNGLPAQQGGCVWCWIIAILLLLIIIALVIYFVCKKKKKASEQAK